MHHKSDILSEQSLLDHQRRITSASFLMMGSILLSRIVGFFRDWVLARAVGANSMTDVYYASFTIPDFLNHLMAAGALSISFIPILSSFISEGRSDLGKLVFRSISTVMGALLILMIIFAEIYAEQLAVLVAPGFSLEQRQLLTQLLRVILPAQFFFYWGGLAISVQHSHGFFGLPAVAPIVYNIMIVAFGLFLHEELGVMGFSIGILVGAATGHGLLQAIGVRRLGYRLTPYLRFPVEIRIALRRYLWLTFPIMLGFSLVVADEWISKFFASSLEERAVSWLSYARTEMRIPVAIIGQAAGIASFPFLSRLWWEGARDQYAKTLLREIQKLWAAAPLAAILLIDHALPITHFIYGGGRFTAEDLKNTSEALRMFGIGVFFWAFQVLLARGFYACERTWLPSILGSFVSIGIVPVYWVLGQNLGFRGLALSGSIGIVIYCLLLWIFLVHHLRKNCPEASFSIFYRFCFEWCGVLVICGLLSRGILNMGIYQNTPLSALIDILILLLVVLPVGWGALRTYFKRYTGTPLF